MHRRHCAAQAAQHGQVVDGCLRQERLRVVYSAMQFTGSSASLRYRTCGVWNLQVCGPSEQSAWEAGSPNCCPSSLGYHREAEPIGRAERSARWRSKGGRREARRTSAQRPSLSVSRVRRHAICRVHDAWGAGSGFSLPALGLVPISLSAAGMQDHHKRPWGTPEAMGNSCHERVGDAILSRTQHTNPAIVHAA